MSLVVPRRLTSVCPASPPVRLLAYSRVGFASVVHALHVSSLLATCHSAVVGHRIMVPRVLAAANQLGSVHRPRSASPKEEAGSFLFVEKSRCSGFDFWLPDAASSLFRALANPTIRSVSQLSRWPWPMLPTTADQRSAVLLVVAPKAEYGGDSESHPR